MLMHIMDMIKIIKHNQLCSQDETSKNQLTENRRFVKLKGEKHYWKNIKKTK